VRRPPILGPPVRHRLTRPRRFLVVSLAKRANGPIEQLVGIVLAWPLGLSRIGELLHQPLATLAADVSFYAPGQRAKSGQRAVPMLAGPRIPLRL